VGERKQRVTWRHIHAAGERMVNWPAGTGRDNPLTVRALKQAAAS